MQLQDGSRKRQVPSDSRVLGGSLLRACRSSKLPLTGKLRGKGQETHKYEILYSSVGAALEAILQACTESLGLADMCKAGDNPATDLST